MHEHLSLRRCAIGALILASNCVYTNSTLAEKSNHGSHDAPTSKAVSDAMLGADSSRKKGPNPNHERAASGGLAGFEGIGDPVCVCEDFFLGDEVVATTSLLDGPGPGAVGMVLGGRVFGSSFDQLLVFWYSFHGGHDGFNAQDCPAQLPDGWIITNECWYVGCSDVIRVAATTCTCNGVFSTGDKVISTLALDSGPQPGTTGTVMGGLSLYGSVLVEFDNWFGGHDSNGFVTCPPVTPKGTSRWYVSCNEIIPIEIPPSCPGDLDANGIIDGFDLTALLGNWGACP